MDRSANMRAIKSTGMKPEMAIRSLVHRMGYRFRLHRRDLPGTPDLVFGPRRKVIFVHGCFWHSHGCSLSHSPKTNRSYWVPKLTRNQERDKRTAQELASSGWKTLIILECQAGNLRLLKKRLKAFLG